MNELFERSDREFDGFLRAKFPELGLRDQTDVIACAAEHGFALQDNVAMPANNRSLIFRPA